MNAETKTAGQTATAGETADNGARMVRAVTVAEVRRIVESKGARGAYANGVKAAALDLLAKLDESAEYNKWPNGVIPAERKADLDRLLLNGATDWTMYSGGGCALVANSDIAERFFPPSGRNAALRRCDDEPAYLLLDVQATALCKAAGVIFNAWREAANA